ncbi:DUF1858 domain-containing protein [candidate division KSB1 bacterium]|nr:DUF1858 domain-containing protein [candidate division KSB1 bacterium]RQW02354.1 MAG: DUF1858 domain-containing protein [candidate division KSB1 bacterium]
MKLEITPRVKVAQLLDAYPELEDKLIAKVPMFSRLKNPVLRKTVAKVTSLQQAANVGNIAIDELVNDLREAVGQPKLNVQVETDGVPSQPPDWFDDSKITKTLDARELLAAGEYPYRQVSQDLQELQPGQIYKVIADFLPAPMIDKLSEQGMQHWSRKLDDVYHIYLKSVK